MLFMGGECQAPSLRVAHAILKRPVFDDLATRLRPVAHEVGHVSQAVREVLDVGIGAHVSIFASHEKTFVRNLRLSA